MLANTNYAQQERLQLGHILKTFSDATSPSEAQLPSPPFGPVEDHHLALQSTESRPGSVCACVCSFHLEEGGFMGFDLDI